MIKKNNYRYELIDVLRGISILLVILTHVQIRIPFEETFLFSNLPSAIWSFLFKSGNGGVRMFFTISGFLITMTSIKRWEALPLINSKYFYRIRFARIAPNLLGILLILSVLHFLGVQNYVIKTEGVSYLRALISALTFHVNWLEGTYGYLPGSWDILWSLSVEEAFYLFFPIVCLSFRNKRLGFFVILFFIIAGPVSRSLITENPIWRSKAYLSCMDAIALGCLTAYLSYGKHFSKTVLKLFFSVGSTLVIIVLLFKKDPVFDQITKYGLESTVLSLGTSLLMIVGARWSFGSVFKKISMPMIFMGKRSYEIYLTHMFVVYTGVDLYHNSALSIDFSFLFLTLIIIVSTILGYIIEKYFSSPLNQKLRHGI